jgi:4-amino-4-deoxy-L-arabinose transferase-like glycosyltransferase
LWFKAYSKIAFWIGLFLLVHLIGICHPPIEAAHSWRQATGLMVARNYFEGNTSFFYPMVDETNGGTGIIGMEFPIMYYIQGKLAYLFGFHVAIGRLINVIVSSFGVAYFYALIRRFAIEKTAFYATLLLMISCFFMYSRKVMPDTEAIAFYIIGIYYYFIALTRANLKDIGLAFFFLSLGLLVKIAVLPLIAVVVFSYLYYRNKPKKSGVFLLPIIALVPAFFWYFVWNPHLAVTYGNWYNIGGNLSDGAQALMDTPLRLLEQVFFHPFFSYLVWGVLLFGLYKVISHGITLALSLSLTLFLILFTAYALKSGNIFISHEYYILPLVPVLAVVGGYGLTQIGKYAWLFMFVIAVEALANQAHDFRFNRNEAYKLTLTAIGSKFIPKNALVAINGNSNPQELYFLGRRGWNLSDDLLCNKEQQHALKAKGCMFWVFNKHIMKCWTPEGILLVNSKDYLLIKSIE